MPVSAYMRVYAYIARICAYMRRYGYMRTCVYMRIYACMRICPYMRICAYIRIDTYIRAGKPGNPCKLPGAPRYPLDGSRVPPHALSSPWGTALDGPHTPSRALSQDSSITSFAQFGDQKP